MKLEGLTAEEATKIVLNDGEVEDKDGGRWNSGHLRLPFAENNAPFRVVTPPPDAEPVVTAEELLFCFNGTRQSGQHDTINVRMAYEKLDDLKAARKPKPEPTPIRTLAEAWECRELKFEWPGRTGQRIMFRRRDEHWNEAQEALIMAHLDGYDKGRRVYDASKEEQAK